MSRVMRSVRNVTKGYSSTQIKVREATSNDPWGPTGTQMSEIAQMTFNTSSDFYDIMDMLDKRLNDKGKNWRHVLKALKVLDYCLHEGSELVVSWARQSIYIIKTLREFQYVDEEGRDVGQNVRIAAKEITSLILDEERLRAERSDRKSWKSRVTGLEEFPPPGMEASMSSPGRDRRGQRDRRQNTDEEDAEYKLALEASKFQEEEDRRKREGRGHVAEDDDDLAKAIKLSKEEEERRRRELEETNAASLFGDSPAQPAQQNYTGFNGGYQQGNQVDWFANPVDQNQNQNQMQTQPTGFMPNAYTSYQQPQATGFQNTFNTPFGTQPTGVNPYGQQQQGFQSQPTGFNAYGQQPQALQQQPTMLQSPVDGPGPSAGTNNPWATNSNSSNSQAAVMKPTPTGSNNPFAQFHRPSSAQPTMSSLGAVPEQKTLASFQSQPGQLQHQASFGQQPQFQQQSSFSQQQQPSISNPQQKELSEHESKLNSLLATGDGMDTYGNTGQMRIPAQHTAPGTFVNSAGSGISRLQAEQTGNNPFLRQQFTGMPSVSYGSQPHPPMPTGPAAMNGQGNNNPFGQQQQPGQQQNQDLIQF